MSYQCGRCGAALPPGVLACPQCGETFGRAVPPPESEPMDALLRSRTARGATPTSANGFPSPQTVDAFSAFSSPGVMASRSAQKAPAWVWIGLSVMAFLLICICLAGWAGYAAWMRGQGGEIAFRQHNRIGNAAFRKHDYDKAREEYSQMIALRPRRVDGYLLRGMADEAGGRCRDAIADDSKALSLPDAGMAASDLYYNRGSAEAQIGLYPAAIGDFSQALRSYQRIRRADSGTEIFGYLRSSYQQRAEAEAANHQYAQAEADDDTVIGSYAPGPTDFAKRGKAQAAQGKNAAARADFEQVIRLAPDNPDAYGEEVSFLDKTHQEAAALAVWQQARRALPEDGPGNGRWWGTQGWLQYQSGQFPSAITSDLKALDADRAQAWVRYNLGLCYAAQGNGANAASTYAEALLHSADADRQAALKDIGDALVKQPQSAALHQARQQLASAQARKTPFPRLAQPRTVALAPRVLPAPPLSRKSAGGGAEVILGDYAIQPPAGYALTQTPFDDAVGSGTIFLWTGSQRPDKTAPTLEIVIGQRQGGSITDENTSDETAQRALGMERSRHTNFVPSPMQQVTLGGLTFTHVTWAGIGQKTGKQFAGSVDTSVTNGTTIRISTHDAAPGSHITLPLLQKSILTFRQR